MDVVRRIEHLVLAMMRPVESSFSVDFVGTTDTTLTQREDPSRSRLMIINNKNLQNIIHMHIYVYIYINLNKILYIYIYIYNNFV